MAGRWDAGGDVGAWYEPVLESIRTAGPTFPGEGAGAIDPGVPPPPLPGPSCDGDDPCLARWEDDGGGLGPIRPAGTPLDGWPRPDALFHSLEEAPR